MAALAETGWKGRTGFGVVAGVTIAAVDNLLFQGEVSPIVIVGLLLVMGGVAGVVWGRRGWLAALVGWVWVPGAHLVKHGFGLPDTLHPNTYTSILKLAAFSLVVTSVGVGSGSLARWVLMRGTGASRT